MGKGFWEVSVEIKIIFSNLFFPVNLGYHPHKY